MFDASLKLLLRRLGLLLALYMLLRIVFYAFNYHAFTEAGVGETILAFLHGLRFDVAAIFAVNSVFILLSLLPAGNTLHPRYQRMLKWVFLLSNAPFIALALVDVEFFKFIGRRSSNEIVAITEDIAGQLGQLISYYWYLPLGFALLLYGLAKVYPKAPAQPKPQPNVWVRSLRLLVVAAFVVLGIRGGLQLKPLRPSHAFVLDSAALGHVSLNSPFTFIKGVGQTKLEEKHYFGTDEELLAALQFNPQQYAAPKSAPKKDNVVIIILDRKSVV